MNISFEYGKHTGVVMIKIRYTASDSVAMADANVKLFVSEMIARNKRGEKCDVAISNESVIFEFRIRIGLGELENTDIEIVDERDIDNVIVLPIQSNGGLGCNVPADFCDFTSQQALALLGAMLKK
jgi:hypothetical protein